MPDPRPDRLKTASGGSGQSLLEKEIPLQPEVLRRAAESFTIPISQLITALADRNVDDWVVTGCGDSFFAGLCAEVWFARLAGRRLRAVQAMQLARETYDSLTLRSVVLAVSHSGTTARVVEAARAAHSRDAFVVAVTGDPTSELALSADFCIDNSVREERSNCRTASFQAVSLLMRMLAQVVATGDDREVRPVNQALLEPYVKESRREIDQLSESDFSSDDWVFTGSGLSYATAEYGKAKAYEAATLAARSVELEQFVHGEIFTVRHGTKVVIICPAGRAISRAVELARGLAELGATTISVTDDARLAEVSTHVLRLPANMHEDDVPFLAILPLQWLALRLAQARGEDPDLVANKWVNRPLIDHSAQWGPEMYGLNVAGLGGRDAASDEPSDAPASTSYLCGLRDLLERIAIKQGPQIEAAATSMAHCIGGGGIVHLFGSGHSMLPALEAFPRYGSFVGLHPIIDPRLLWFNVLGSFGVPEMLFLQNTEGYADVMLDGQHLYAGDVLVVFSHAGTSAVVVDAARFAKRRGLSVIAISSSATSAAVARHSSGLKLTNLADLTIDTFAPRGEALVAIDGLEEPVGAATTVLAMSAGLAAIARTAQLLVAGGHRIVQSVRAEKNETSAYRAVYDAYENTLRRQPTP